ncbi:membrane-associated progesterone receptor component, partial [Phenoliferia sp. Uapishka_3]
MVSTIKALNLTNPLNIVLLVLSLYLISSLLPAKPFIPFPSTLATAPIQYNWRPATHPATLVWRTWRPLELRSYDGTTMDGDEQGRIMFAIRRKVYDVTSGRGFYGPASAAKGGPYATFAGRDASRGLAKQSFEPEMLTPLDEPIDELKDLTAAEWDNLRDWESHFVNKYILCGTLSTPSCFSSRLRSLRPSCQKARVEHRFASLERHEDEGRLAALAIREVYLHEERPAFVKLPRQDLKEAVQSLRKVVEIGSIVHEAATKLLEMILSRNFQMTGYLESKTSFLAFLLTDNHEDGPTSSTPGFSADVTSVTQDLEEADLKDLPQSSASNAVPPEGHSADPAPTSSRSRSSKLLSRSGKRISSLSKVFKMEETSGRHEDSQKLRESRSAGFDGTPAPLEIWLKSRVAEFTGTYERVLLFRRGNREIMFATAELLSSCGLKPQDELAEGSSSIINMDVLKLVSGKTRAESETVRAKVTTAIKKSEVQHFDRPFHPVPTASSGSQITLIECPGFLHISPLMDKPGDCVAFVAIFEPEMHRR